MAQRKRNKLRKAGVILGVFLLVAAAAAVYFHVRTRVKPPDPGVSADVFPQADSVGPGFYRAGRNWLRKNQYGNWEMYLEGAAFERGVVAGRLCRHLVEYQEDAFIGQIREMIPSDFYLRFLKYFIYWFNRDLDRYIPEEYRQEIYGISLSASDRFGFIGTPYQRMLNYHSAHDIGHALQDYMLVGCTSFGVWGHRSKDSTLLIGRNFDFYVGDDFAKNKIVCFVKPDRGHPFMMVTWAGMTGAVSGMNAEGLTVTINAAKSSIPGSARTPISILAREILQYASTLREARDIAGKRETFVSESILVGSARDKHAIIIEKSPFRMGIVSSPADFIVCANHFQSAAFRNDPLNRRDMQENASVYRQHRLLEDIGNHAPLGPAEAATILRDRKGLNEADIGMGNEKAMNQLIAHHSVIFQPENRLAWVSSAPWQEGPYMCYDLRKIFRTFAVLLPDREIAEQERAIPPDPFLGTEDYRRFLQFRTWKKELRHHLRTGEPAAPRGGFTPDRFRDTNPRFYEVYELLGDFYSGRKDWGKAAEAYGQALRLVIPRWQEKRNIARKLVDCREKIRP
ncbi:MAG TPA: C45 family autoproteolytic acyltransferase/hydrolase [Bacteroidales bacterium]|nr:C45 family autoproteolytic acyltransferase/hydrolase [Bacteroidales bacterium]